MKKQPVANIQLSNKALETTKLFPWTFRGVYVRDMCLLRFAMLLANSKTDGKLVQDTVTEFFIYKW